MPEIITIISVLLIGIATGFVDTTISSGGLISVPFLIFMGLSPASAIATDRLGSIGQTLTSLPKFWKEKKVLWKYVPFFTILSMVGAMIGANILLNLNQNTLNKIIGTVILILLPLIFLKPELGIKRKKTSKLKLGIGFSLYFLLTIFSGFFGAGTGTISIYMIMYLFGFTIIEIMATGKIPWFVLSLTSLIVFAKSGIINYSFGIVLFIGGAVGGYLGTHLVLKKGNQWVKRLFIVVVIIAAIRLLFL